jgi:hypothetical protein
MKTPEQLRKERLARSQELANAVKAGTYIPAAFDSQASYFPARPLVKKDPKELARLYGPAADSVR